LWAPCQSSLDTDCSLVLCWEVHVAIGLKGQRYMVFSNAAIGLLISMYARVLQFGQGYQAPNNPNTVPSIVKYGYSANNLEFSETGFAEVMLTHLPA
jgi:hypothetical protein